MAEALERVIPFDTEGIPRKACSPAGLFPIEDFSSTGGNSQKKLSPPGLRLNLLTVKPLYIPLDEEETSWIVLPRVPELGLD